MADGETVAARDAVSALENIAFCFWDRRGRERPHVEKHNDLGTSMEFAHKLGEDDGEVCWVASFVEENPNAGDGTDETAAEGWREADFITFLDLIWLLGGR